MLHISVFSLVMSANSGLTGFLAISIETKCVDVHEGKMEGLGNDHFVMALLFNQALLENYQIKNKFV